VLRKTESRSCGAWRDPGDPRRKLTSDRGKKKSNRSDGATIPDGNRSAGSFADTGAETLWIPPFVLTTHFRLPTARYNVLKLSLGMSTC